MSHSPAIPADELHDRSPGKVGTWLFLASEVMFFIGILGSYIVLRAGSPELFRSSAESLNKLLAGTNTLVLILSSLTMALAVDAARAGNRRKLGVCLLITLVCAFGFLGIKFVEYRAKFTHVTLLAKVEDRSFVYDGHVESREPGGMVRLHGYRSSRLADSNTLNLNDLTEADVRHATQFETGKAPAAQEFEIPANGIVQQVSYGPWKNIFFASYFTLTGIHGLHVLGGIIALGILLVQSMRGKVFPNHTENVGLYWHFVDLVWIFLFPLLYLM